MLKTETSRFKTFCKNIFSINDYSELRNEIRFFGLKIRVQKRSIAEKRKQNPYYYYKKHNIDITTVPPATGQLRELQLSNFALLTEMDYVCKKNNLKYWLDFGTLLGAIRHKGFIPWDDDVDISMLREDYDKLIDAFKESSRNPDIFADYIKDEGGCFIKIQHKLCPMLFVDIFPWDRYGKKLSVDEQLEKSQEIKKIRKQSKIFDTDDKEFIKKKSYELIQSQIITQEKDINGDFVWGLDYGHNWKNWFTHYDDLFPLKTIEFEGLELPCPNNPDSYLTKIYGNYMSYPEKMRVGHSMFLNYSEQEKNVIKELIQKID